MSTGMAAEPENEKFYVTKEQLIIDEDENYKYEEIPVDDDVISQGIDEDLDLAVRTIQEAAHDVALSTRREAAVTQRPEVVDDFVRNFLVRMGMLETLDCFQTEWYELQQKGEFKDKDVGITPDIYIKNHRLEADLKFYKQEMEKFKNAALKAKDTYTKLRKERDFHKMHHKRIVQEKNRLITDIKRLKNHYSSYEPTLKHLKQKYETAMKEKMLTKLERDRAVGQVHGLKSTLKNIESYRGSSATTTQMAMGATGLQPAKRGSANVMVDQEGRGPTQRHLAAQRATWEGTDVANDNTIKHPNDSVFPVDSGVNPYLSQSRSPPGHLTRTGGFRLSNTFQAHSHAVSYLALHPRKQILASTSDDHSWKLWAVPSGDIIMTGVGHSDWVSSCDFHPSGSRLATTSGDTTVKLWDFSKAECIHTFTDHTHAVWGCSWHSCGDFLATCSLDNTSKVWDINSQRCRFTLRGHTESVNSIQFLPFSNTLITCSADKTISLWDARTGLCAQTFYGHMHSVNDITFNLKGDTIASCDSYGVVNLWDVRTVSQMTSMDCGPYSANQVTFDPSGSVLAISSNDASIKMYEVANGQMTSLVGHEDAVQTAIFDRKGEFLVSGGSDLSVRIWS